MNGPGNDIALVLISLLPIVFSLGFFVFSIFFVVKVILFMNAKIKTDRERNEKLDELIKVISQSSSNKNE